MMVIMRFANNLPRANISLWNIQLTNNIIGRRVLLFNKPNELLVGFCLLGIKFKVILQVLPI